MQRKILIVGGGIAGLSLGLALEQRGIAADVVERLAAPSPSGTGPYLDAALASYSQRRRPRVRWVQRQCAARDKMRAMPAPARAAIFGLVGDKLYRRSHGPLLAPP